jgi:uncharacterized protein YdeI (YjbR/CyaY-like superfamily)
VPNDLQIALHANDSARKHFENFSDSSKRIILEWIYSAKGDETRRKRVQETVHLAEQGIKAHQ